jgi:hypothetical protein
MAESEVDEEEIELQWPVHEFTWRTGATHNVHVLVF